CFLASRRNSRLMRVSSSSLGGLIEGMLGSPIELQPVMSNETITAHAQSTCQGPRAVARRVIEEV
ncbi:MAG TPA: hypothetical protein VF130_00715, partial [Candidatus Binatia bacterium]